MPIVFDLSATVCVIGAIFACIQAARAPHRLLAPTALAMTALGGWAVVATIYLRAPFSSPRVHAVLSALCLAPAPWLAAALTLRDSDFDSVWKRWRGYVLAQAGASVAAAVLMYTSGIDWITGIGPQPTTVLTHWGIVALAIGALPACAAVVLVAGQLSAGMTTTPALLLGMLGAASSLLWVAALTLWSGYLTPTPVVSCLAVGAVATLLWSVGALREVRPGSQLVPSRRLVYGATAASLVAAYILAAHVALGWAAELARNAMSTIAPALAFALVAGLVLLGSSKRWRHRLWVTIGRHLFHSKHDYGEVWIRLTELVSSAHTVRHLVQGAAVLCHNVLGGSDVSVWLTDSSGGLWRAATTAGAPAAPDDNDNGEARPQLSLPDVDNGNGTSGSQATEEFALARLVGASFACALRLNGRVLGIFAIDAVDTGDSGVVLDDEDRRLVRYIAAQVASALGLFRLGEEVAHAREVGSFHRLSTFVVHDLKNLVAQQTLVLENATRFRNDPAFVQDALAAMDDSTVRMRSLIARLRSRESTNPTSPNHCDLLAVIGELIAVPQVARRRGSRINLRVPAGERQCFVSVDQSAAAQVFSNLLVNAVESLPAEAGEITVSITPAPDSWRVEVQDNGSGIPPGFLRDQLFRPFQTTKDQGLGIGLYQCKSIVDAAGGTIAINSAPGAGTRVQVTLPALTFTDRGEDRHRGDAA
jgi:putative PEP-CTERM system histidine kinase